MSSSNATSMSVYQNSKIWGLFNGRTSFMGLVPPARGVDMFRNTWCASVRTELPNALVAWRCDSQETPSHTETNVPDSFANQSCTPPAGSESVRGGLPQPGPGLGFFCHFPRVARFKNDR